MFFCSLAREAIRGNNTNRRIACYFTDCWQLQGSVLVTLLSGSIFLRLRKRNIGDLERKTSPQRFFLPVGSGNSKGIMRWSANSTRENHFLNPGEVRG